MGVIKVAKFTIKVIANGHWCHSIGHVSFLGLRASGNLPVSYVLTGNLPVAYHQ